MMIYDDRDWQKFKPYETKPAGFLESSFIVACFLLAAWLIDSLVELVIAGL